MVSYPICYLGIFCKTQKKKERKNKRILIVSFNRCKRDKRKILKIMIIRNLSDFSIYFMSFNTNLLHFIFLNRKDLNLFNAACLIALFSLNITYQNIVITKSLKSIII